MTTVWNGPPAAAPAAPGRLNLGERIAQALGVRGKLPPLRLAGDVSLVVEVGTMLEPPFQINSIFSAARVFAAAGVGNTNGLCFVNRSDDPFQAVVIDRVLMTSLAQADYVIRTGAESTTGFIASDADVRMNAAGTDTLSAEVRGNEQTSTPAILAGFFPRLQWAATVAAGVPIEATGPWTLRPGTALLIMPTTTNIAWTLSVYGRTYRES